MKTLLDQQLDQSTDMDLMAGLPHMEGGQWAAALRNLGSTDVTVNVLATTDTGQQVTAPGTVPAHDFGQVTFKTASRIVRVEIDPEKFYPQTDYSNDAAPRSVELASSLAEDERLERVHLALVVARLARDAHPIEGDLEATSILQQRVPGPDRGEERRKRSVWRRAPLED